MKNVEVTDFISKMKKCSFKTDELTDIKIDENGETVYKVKKDFDLMYVVKLVSKNNTEGESELLNLLALIYDVAYHIDEESNLGFVKELFKLDSIVKSYIVIRINTIDDVYVKQECIVNIKPNIDECIIELLYEKA